MACRPWARSIPEEFARLFFDPGVVYAGNADAHQAVLIELPIFIAVAPVPLILVISPFISEAHSHAIFTEAPQLFDQPIIGFMLPFVGEEGLDLRAALEKFCAMAPLAVQ